MKDSFTLPLPERKEENTMQCLADEQLLSPSEKTLMLLRLFARNCKVEPSLPDGLQEMILG